MMVAGGAEFSHLFYTEFGRPALPRLAQFCVSSIRGILITGGAAITVTGSDAVKNIAPCTAVKICVKSLHDNNNMNVNI